MKGIDRFFVLRMLLAIVFLLAAAGKLLAPESTGELLSRALHVAPAVAVNLARVVAIIELLAAVWVLSGQRVVVLLPVPLIFAAFLLYSRAAQTDCGCFGPLPLLDRMPFAAHLLLLAGMFLAIWSLMRAPRTSSDAGGKNAALALVAGGMIAVALLWPLLLPRPASSPAAGIPTVSLDQVWAAIDDSAFVLVDARSEFQYEMGHVPGAVNLPVDSDSLPARLEKLDLKDKRIIVYCAGAHCNAAERLAERLKELGYRRVFVFPGGWEEWTAQE